MNYFCEKGSARIFGSALSVTSIRPKRPGFAGLRQATELSTLRLHQYLSMVVRQSSDQSERLPSKKTRDFKLQH